jgi:hypothetical protein
MSAADLLECSSLHIPTLWSLISMYITLKSLDLLYVQDAVAGSSKTLVTFYQTARRHIPDDCREDHKLLIAHN